MIKHLLLLVYSLCIMYSSAYTYEKNTRGLHNYPNYYFIETGTADGDGVQEALVSQAFTFFYSIDIYNSDTADIQDRFLNKPMVESIEGDSGVDLTSILDDINLPATFWLDAEQSCYDEAAAKMAAGAISQISPLLYELSQIQSHYIKTHTILINNSPYANEFSKRIF